MVRPAARRQAVEYVRTAYQLGDPLLARLRALATTRPRAGYRTLGRLLRREGNRVNDKRVYRLYRSEGLSLRVKRRRRHPASARVVPQPAMRPWQRWAMDFMSDSTTDGHRFRMLTLVDIFTRRGPGVVIERSIGGPRVVRFLDEVAAVHGYPESINIDNGPEFVSKALDQWAHAHGVTLYFSRPGKPVDNAFIESFNGRLRDECLNTNWFYGLEQAREVIGAWLEDYNQHRPHSSLAGLTPVEYERSQLRTSRTD